VSLTPGLALGENALYWAVTLLIDNSTRSSNRSTKKDEARVRARRVAAVRDRRSRFVARSLRPNRFFIRDIESDPHCVGMASTRRYTESGLTYAPSCGGHSPRLHRRCRTGIKSANS